MSSPISHSPLSSSAANPARMSFWVQLILGGSLAAVVLFLGVIVWRLAQLPPSSKTAAQRPRPVRTEQPSPRQTVVVIEPRKELADPEPQTEYAAAVPKIDVPVAQPEAKPATVDLPRPPEALTADQIFEQRLQVSEEELRRQLYEVPELRLLADADVRDLRARQAIAMRGALQGSVEAVRSERKSAKIKRTAEVRRAEAAFTAAAQARVAAEFNRNLQQSLQEAARRAGLALQEGLSRELDPNVAADIAELSTELRGLGFVTALGLPSPRRAGSRNTVVSDSSLGPEEAAVSKVKAFQKWCDQNGVERLSGAVPTLAQMLQVENEPTRLLLVRELARMKSTASTAKLAERAIMDLSPEVRRAAVAALSGRPRREYVPLLIRGLRYPWPPVADHAAIALRTLKPREAVAPLVGLLDLPSPALPVLDARTHQYSVHELVRLNHMRNCLLCHAVSENKEDGLVRGVVPTPGMPLSRPSGGGDNYYSALHGDFVRADITYIHQDFSLLMQDENIAPWPSQQRYDFVTRLQPVPPAVARKLLGSPTDYPQRDAVLYALRGLTGKDGGASSDKWRELLGITTEGRRSVPPLVSDYTIKASTPP